MKQFWVKYSQLFSDFKQSNLLKTETTDALTVLDIKNKIIFGLIHRVVLQSILTVLIRNATMAEHFFIFVPMDSTIQFSDEQCILKIFQPTHRLSRGFSSQNHMVESVDTNFQALYICLSTFCVSMKQLFGFM
jgi:hypothetical protein